MNTTNIALNKKITDLMAINQSLKEEVICLKMIITNQKNSQKLIYKKYQQSDKGKAAQKKANTKYKPPTGKPRGRPKKILE